MARAYQFVYSALLVAALAFVCAAQTQSTQQSSSTVTAQNIQLAHEVPVMNGGAGPCSLELTVTTADGKPVYDATIKVHIAYGFAGFHRLDLQAATNVDGKVRFLGIPSRVHRPPLDFHAAKDQLAGTVMVDPGADCDGKQVVILQSPTAAPVNSH
jgi:hypothetical protein